MEVMLDMRDLQRKEEWDETVWPGHVDVEAIWSCVMCGACVEECPLLLDQAETLMELRRGVYFEEAHVSRDVQLISNNIMKRGNPYGFSSSEKEPWIMELIEKELCELAEENEEYDYLLWIGCVTSFDPQIRKSTESFLRLMKKAGYRIAVLADEQCCGDPARRVGDELMFFETVTINQEILEGYKYGKLITSCPHCYNSFKNEYKGYGYEPDVEHSTVTLSQLLKEGKLKPMVPVETTITFHDSCFLGRWNDIYQAPRDIITSVPGVKLVEMERNQSKAFCCGGGGSQLFYEIEEGERISKMRVKEAEKTGASSMVVACPYCNTMFVGEDSEMSIMDINELLEKSIK
jgi:Fe-S oxidoreductase